MTLTLSKRVGVAGTALAISLVSLATIAPQGNAEPTRAGTTGERPALPEGVSLQENKVEAAAAAFFDGLDAQYGDRLKLSAQIDAGRLTVAAPPELLGSLGKLDGSSVEGLEVDVIEARFTPADLDQIIMEIAAEDPALNKQIAYYNLPAKADRIQVAVDDLGQVAQRSATTLEQQISAVVGGPVELVPAVVMQNFSRQNDASPWWGGGLMRHFPDSANHLCTAGFAVLDGVAGRLLSAAHCDSGDGSPVWTWKDGAGDDFVNAAGIDATGPGLDSMLMDPDGGTAGKVFGGPWNAGTGHARYDLSVKGAGNAFEGLLVCASGGNSGEHCSQRVDGSAHASCTAVGVCHRWLAQGTANIGACEGDSGGPVYSNNDNPLNVTARGIIKGGYYTNSSTPEDTRFADACKQGVIFTGIEDILDYWNVAIETS